MAKVKKKKIIIDTIGQIPIMGGIAGPILTPFLQDVETIRHLIAVRVDVMEVLSDGTQIRLDLYNYDEKILPQRKQKPIPANAGTPIGDVSVNRDEQPRVEQNKKVDNNKKPNEEKGNQQKK